ncbi:radical SAM protein [Marinifilum sp. D737]|uniref:radical SAM protein n=1 Tax=Marinifilum sp. D737 TaxID=2969628 RepID=UPI0022762B5D|nr:radical SAM protein [Marinifilum sp. D737]MCY1634296.1 radical SAM protein [Marinifilum sp. D737]
MRTISFPLCVIWQYKDISVLFDAKSNTILELQSEDKQLLIDYFFNNKSRLNFQRNNLLHILHENGILIPEGLKERCITNKEHVERNIDKERKLSFFKKFSLEITQECNLRCKYCHYTIARDFRKHTSKKMSIQIGKLAIDFYFENAKRIYGSIGAKEFVRSIKEAEPIFLFYGGEPLLSFETIKTLINYLRGKSWCKLGISPSEIKLGISTNLTILNESMLKYLIENNIFLYVSIDGPENIHNNNRIYQNGRGSFKDVEGNICKIIKANSKYYLNNVFFMSVNSHWDDKDAKQQYFETLSLNGNLPYVNYLSLSKRGESVADVYQKLGGVEEELETFENKMNEWLNFLKVNSFFLKDLARKRNYLLRDLLSIINEFKDVNNAKFMSNNSNLYDSVELCKVGCDNLYVDVEGYFHICEKTDGSITLGNVKEGVTWEKVLSIKTEYLKLMNSKRCKHCINYFYCKICIASIIHRGSLTMPKEIDCEYLKQLRKERVLKYVILIRKFPEILNEIENLKVT